MGIETGGNRPVAQWHDRKLAKIEAKIDGALGQVALLAAAAANAWATKETAASLRACADRLDKLAWRYDRLGAVERDAGARRAWRGSVSAGARTEAAVARSIAEALDDGDADEARRRLMAHLEDDPWA